MNRMDEPPRLTEDFGVPAGLRELLGAAQQDGLSPKELEHVVHGVETKLNPVPSDDPSSGLKTSARPRALGKAGTRLTSSLAAKIGIVLLVAAGVGGSIGYVAIKRSERPLPTPVVTPVAVETAKVEALLSVSGAQSDPSTAVREVPAIPAEAPVTNTIQKPVRGTSATIQPKRSAESRSGATDDAASMVEEHRLLRAARASLADNPQQAFNLTQEHRRRFPQGMLSQEREVLAIEALSRLGKSSEARTRAGQFSQRYPDSPHRARVLQSSPSSSSATHQ